MRGRTALICMRVLSSRLGCANGSTAYCRYALRPPVTEERIHLTDEGQVRWQLRQPWRDGTTDVVFDPVEFLGRLAALVPRPRINLIMYHCVLGPRAAWLGGGGATSGVRGWWRGGREGLDHRAAS